VGGGVGHADGEATLACASASDTVGSLRGGGCGVGEGPETGGLIRITIPPIRSHSTTAASTRTASTRTVRSSAGGSTTRAHGPREPAATPPASQSRPSFTSSRKIVSACRLPAGRRRAGHRCAPRSRAGNRWLRWAPRFPNLACIASFAHHSYTTGCLEVRTRALVVCG
jgi:hypothetical protein